MLPSQLVAPTSRPTPDAHATVPPERLAGDDESAAQPDAASDEPRVRPARVIVVGGFPALTKAAREVDQQLRGRTVSLREIQRAAAQLEGRYAAAGYPLARVVVPPQRLADDGPLTLRVVDGFIEDIVVDGVDAAMRAPVRKRLQPLVGVRSLTLAALERAVLLAGELPGLRLRSALVRGRQEGGVRLVVDGTHDPAAAQLRVDNALPKSFGRREANGTLSLNSPFGTGEQWYAATAQAPRQDDSRPAALASYGVGVMMPTPSIGTTVNLEYAWADTAPHTDAGTLATTATYRRWSVRTTYALVRRHDRRIDVQAGVDGIEQRLIASDFAVDLNRDHYGALRLGWAGAFLLSRATSLQARLFADAGLGGRGDADVASSGVPLSRAGASSHFDKAGFESNLLSTSANWQFDMRMRGQSAARPLLTPEGLSLASPDTLSAFDAGTLNVDTGLVARAQLGRRLAMPGTAEYAPGCLVYSFVGAGHGHVFDATAVQRASLDAVAAGVGLRLAYTRRPGQSLALNVEAATGHTNGGTPGRSSRIGLSLEAHL
ncbi:MAG TPA: ShlB/FhaC/HecB family hemolysin secretion/activation protein [Burkholderiaceae bacterium]